MIAAAVVEPVPVPPHPVRAGSAGPEAPAVRRRRWRLVPALADAAAVATAALCGGLPVRSVAAWALLAALALVLDGSHRPRITTHVGTRVPRLVAAVAVPLPLVVLAGGYVGSWRPAGALALAGVLVGSARAVAGAATRARRRRGHLEPAAVVGSGPVARRLVTAMVEHPELGLAPVAGPIGVPELAALRATVSRVIVADGLDAAAERALHTARGFGVPVWVVAPRAALAVPVGHLDDLWGTPLIPLRPLPDERGVASRLRHAADLVVAGVLVAVAVPVVLVAAALTGPGRLGGPGPAFYRQPRLSRGGAVVPITKIRTVPAGAPESWAVPPGGCTRWGRALRRTHIDELPQLLAVLRGHLALVGPRPERPEYAARFARTVPGYADRLRVRGGITGWAQVHGLSGDTSLTDRARFDNHYIEYRSVWLDLVIVLRTLLAVAEPPPPRSTGGTS